jgi:beta-lactam-binding protein with PASTA domain
MSVRLAMMKLGEVGLRVGATDHAASDAIPAGQVMATNPPSGAPVPAAGDVSLLVSRKKAPIPLWMPDLAGRSANETAAWLESCGFQVRIEETSLPGNAGAVLEQDPLPGAPVWPGAMVRLTAVRDRDELERDRDRPGRGWRR